MAGWESKAKVTFMKDMEVRLCSRIMYKILEIYQDLPFWPEDTFFFFLAIKKVLLATAFLQF